MRFVLKDVGWAADAVNMLSNPGPTSNYERQREFCERNPGYYAKRKAKERAMEKAHLERMKAEAEAKAVQREPLMLPAPVEMLEIPGMNVIPATMPVREAVEVISGS